MLVRLPCIAVAALALTLLSACGRKQQQADASSALSPATTPAVQVFRVGNGSEPQDLDPQTVTGVPEHHLIQALFEGLASEDPKDLHPVPGVAESWKISDDGLVYTFHLRANAVWSNGDPITAHDFVQSYQRMLSPALASEYAYLIYNFVAGAKDYYQGKITDFSKVGLKALDDRTLQVTLNHPTPYLLQIIASHYAWMPVPIKVLSQHGGLFEKRTHWTRPGNLVGNGPFVLKEWLPHQRIVVTRNPKYWDAANTKLDKIHFFPIEDLAVEERNFRTGQLDMTYDMPNSKIDVYRRENPKALHIEPYLGVYFYRFNVAKPPFNDKRVRQALALAVDRELIVQHITRGGQKPAYAVSYPGTAGYTPRAKLTGTIDDARRLLAEAGFPDGRGFPEVELIYNSSENHRAIAEAIQQMWRKHLGVNITLANKEWRVYLDLQHKKDFTLQRGGWIADYLDPHVFLEIWESDNGNNNTNWSNAEYDRLLNSALSARTNEERYEVYQKLDAILVDELPVIPIYYYTTVRALSPKVQGYHPTLLDSHPYKYMSIGQ